MITLHMHFVMTIDVVLKLLACKDYRQQLFLYLVLGLVLLMHRLLPVHSALVLLLVQIVKLHCRVTFSRL